MTDPSSNPLLVTSELSIGYGLSVVVKSLNLHLDKGELVALLGTNGMGKSTLMSTVAGLMPSLAGTIRLKGEIINEMAAEDVVARGLALVPQGKLLFPSLSVADNLRLGAYHLGGKGAKHLIQRGFEMVFRMFPVLQEKRKQRAGTLSGGQQQMLAIGRGLMGYPEVLLLDEPSTGLAPFVVLELMNALAKLRDETAVSILLAEQNAEAALSVAHRGYVLGGGRMMVEGSAQELVENDVVRRVYLGDMI